MPRLKKGERVILDQILGENLKQTKFIRPREFSNRGKHFSQRHAVSLSSE